MTTPKSASSTNNSDVKPLDGPYRMDGGNGTGDDSLSSMVTIVIVTSPIASNPSTEMIDRCLVGVLRSFPQLRDCRIVIACDGVHEVVDASSSATKPNNSKPVYPTTRRIYGKCTQEQWERYRQYCERLAARKCLVVDRHDEWMGFAMVLHSALAKVTTPIVMVLPHDYELMPATLTDVHLPTLIHEMVPNCIHSSDNNNNNNNNNNNVKKNRIAYIGLPNPRSAKFGSRHSKALKGIPSRRIRRSTIDVPNEIDPPYVLEPLAMWKENPHFATVEAYHSIVFPKDGRRYKRGQFIEDTLGQDMLADIKQRGVGAFRDMYLLSLPQPCSFHLDGPRYLPIEERLARNYSVREFDIQAAQLAKAYGTKQEV